MSIEKRKDENEEITVVERILEDGTKMELIIVNNMPYVTLETAGEVLKYKTKGEQAWKLYNSHKEVLEPYTLLLNLGSNSVGRQTRRLLSKTAFTGLCFYSDSEIAIQRQQEVLKLMEEYETKGYVIPEFDNDYDRQIFLIDRFREAILKQKAMEEEVERHTKQIGDIYSQIEGFIPLTRAEIKQINYSIKLVYKEKGVPYWEVWRKIQEACGIGDIEQASRKHFGEIMRVVNSYLNQRHLRDF